MCHMSPQALGDEVKWQEHAFDGSIDGKIHIIEEHIALKITSSCLFRFYIKFRIYTSGIIRIKPPV